MVFDHHVPIMLKVIGQAVLFVFRKIGKITWAILVAFMIAWHNVYYEETRMPDDIKRKIEHHETVEDNSTK